MVRVRLKGSPQTQWNINGHYYPGRDVVHLTEEEVVENRRVIESIEDEEKKPLLFKEEKPVLSGLLKKYSEKELLALNKDEQAQLLVRLGGKTAPATEKLRVKAILELQ